MSLVGKHHAHPETPRFGLLLFVLIADFGIENQAVRKYLQQVLAKTVQVFVDLPTEFNGVP